MKCGNSALYHFQSACPHCGMKLFEVKDGEMEHTDHNPKHGGDFFMASDGWHHVECALTEKREFKIYIYDNYTKPHPGAHRAQASFFKSGSKAHRSVPLESISGDVLTVSLPEGMSLPIDVAARVAFSNKPNEWVLFNMHYDAFSIDKKVESGSVVRVKTPIDALLEDTYRESNPLMNVCLNCPTPSLPMGWRFFTSYTSYIGYSFPFPYPIAYKPLPPFALIPRKLRVAPTGEVFED